MIVNKADAMEEIERLVQRIKQLEQQVLSASPCSAWISCEQRPPVGEDFGCFFHSVEVLFTDGVDQWIGYLQTWEEDEYDPVWKMKGPDGWDVAKVTHWMPLLSLPNTEVSRTNSRCDH